MKTFFTLLLTTLTLTISAQDTNTPPLDRFLVQFYGANTNGYPVYWPAKCVSVDSNAVEVAGWHLFSQVQYGQLIATNQAEFLVGKSNRLYLRTNAAATDWADFLSKLDRVEAWIDKTSGTNTLNNNQRDAAINDIARAFRKLRPMLRDTYRP